MWLERLQLSGFRAFGEADLTLPQAGLVLITGVNNSGKSTLLAAVDALRGVTPDQPVTNTSHVGPARVTGTFVVDDHVRGVLLKASVDERKDGHAFRRVRVCLEHRTSSGLMDCIAVEATLDDGTFDALGQLIPGPDGERVDVCDAMRWTKDAPIGSIFDRTTAISGSGLGHYLRADAPAIRPVVQALSDWVTGVYHFGTVRPGASRVRPSSGATTLTPTGENLPDVLLQLSSGQTPEWDAIRVVMADLAPDAGTPLAPVVGGQLELLFADASGVRRNLQDLGGGVEQMLMMTVVGETHPSSGMLLIEEPETSLHPGAQRALLRHLTTWAKERPIIATTHSTVFLDRAADAATVWHVERSTATSSVKQIQRDKQLLDSLGVRLSDVFASEKLLLVEGMSDVEVLDVWFGPTLRASGVEIVHIKGSDAARVAERYQLVAEAGHVSERRLMFIRDRDELNEQDVSSIERKGPVRVLPVRELENFFIEQPEAIASALHARLPAVATDPGALATELRERAEGLKALVVLRRVVTSIGPIYPAPWTDMKALRTDPTITQLRTVIDANLERGRLALSDLDDLWNREEAAVEACWNEAWRALVPAAELLSSVWHCRGLTFDKVSDGIAIARAMAPPEPLATWIAMFSVAGKPAAPTTGVAR